MEAKQPQGARKLPAQSRGSVMGTVTCWVTCAGGTGWQENSEAAAGRGEVGETESPEKRIRLCLASPVQHETHPRPGLQGFKPGGPSLFPVNLSPRRVGSSAQPPRKGWEPQVLAHLSLASDVTSRPGYAMVK